MSAPTMIKPGRVFSLDPKEYDPDALAGVREPILAKIKASPEWALLNTGSVPPAQGESLDDDTPF
jgi:hypothetical protein